MVYMGSKNRIAKYIIPIMEKYRTDGQFFVEPFVGGCNLIDKVSGNRMGFDNNPYLIAMWRGLQQDVDRPMEISFEFYDKCRQAYNKNKSGEGMSQRELFTIGWVGYMWSFNGRFYDGGYNGNSTVRNYSKENIANIARQIESIKDVEFYCCSYINSLQYIPPKSIIYCDIPYKNTKQYAYSSDFDHDAFYRWAEDAKDIGHTVFVSEYNMPDPFQCIWEKEITNSLNTKKTYRPTEKLFIL